MKKRKSYMVDINLFCQLSLLSYIVDKVAPVINELLGFVVNRYPFYILKNFNKSLDNLYFQHRIVHAGEAVGKLFSATIDDIRSVVPTISTICNILEFHVMLLLVSFSAMTHSSIFLPGSYIQIKDLWDEMYSIEGQSGFNKAVSRLGPTKLQTFISQFESFRSLLCINDSRFSVILSLKSLIQHSSESKGSVVSSQEDLLSGERLLVLYLVLLSNMESLKLLGSSDIFAQFRNNTIAGDSQLINAFNELGSFSNRDEAKKLLRKLLQQRKDKLIEYQWSVKHARLVTPSLIAPEQNVWRTIKRRKAVVPEPMKEENPIILPKQDILSEEEKPIISLNQDIIFFEEEKPILSPDQETVSYEEEKSIPSPDQETVSYEEEKSIPSPDQETVSYEEEKSIPSPDQETVSYEEEKSIPSPDQETVSYEEEKPIISPDWDISQNNILSESIPQVSKDDFDETVDEQKFSQKDTCDINNENEDSTDYEQDDEMMFELKKKKEKQLQQHMAATKIQHWWKVLSAKIGETEIEQEKIELTKKTKKGN